jgi:predicted membrane channel-forming protein YqfA (hemolysin III family)
MKRTMRGQDFLPLIAGSYAFLAPLWTTTTHRATWTAVILGIVIAGAALAALVEPDRLPFEGFVAFMGALLFVSPWVMNFSAVHPMAWMAYIAGGVTFLVGAADFQFTRSHDHHMAHPH